MEQKTAEAKPYRAWSNLVYTSSGARYVCRSNEDASWITDAMNEAHEAGRLSAKEEVESRDRLIQTYEGALKTIRVTASWYAKNGNRQPHEVDHALCVEVLDEAEHALLSSAKDLGYTPKTNGTDKE